jgi:hypothetical protein
MPIDAVALRRAGFSLDDVIWARDRVRSLRYAHPPPDPRTLFDSQLRWAGYTAADFRQIGYTACEMSSSYFYDADLSEEEREWDVTLAFFYPKELLEAGFDAEQVRLAFAHDHTPLQGHVPHSPGRSRSSSHQPPRRRARLSGEYGGVCVNGHDHGVAAGVGNLQRSPYAHESEHQLHTGKLSARSSH